MSEAEPALPGAGTDDRWRLDGRVALVTGASAGLGARFARVLHTVGAHVIATARATASYSSSVIPGLPLMMKSRCHDAHSYQRSKATRRLLPSAPAMASILAPARTAL